MPLIMRAQNSTRKLTKYEEARIVGQRAVQISRNAKLYIELPEGMTDPLKIAQEEFKAGKIPFIIRRYHPNKSYVDKVL